MNKQQFLSGILNYTWVRVLLYLIAFLITTTVFQMVGVILGAMLLGLNNGSIEDIFAQLDTPQGVNLLLFARAFALIGTLWLTRFFLRYIDNVPFSSVGLTSRKGVLADAVIGFFMGFVLIAVGFTTLYGLGMISINAIQLPILSVLAFFVVCICVAVDEELSCRGYILGNLMNNASIGKYGALAISALIFAILHALNPNITVMGFVNLILAGVLLGIYYLYQKNLWLPIMLHLSWNFFQGPIFGFEVSGFELEAIISHNMVGHPLITGGNFGFEGSILLTPLIVLAIVYLHKRYS